MKNSVCCVIPSWNSQDRIGLCIDSLLGQSLVPHIIVVENGSTDNSLAFLQKNYPEVDLIVHNQNKGFAGGVNAGIRRAIDLEADYVALFNDDAVAEKEWLAQLVKTIETEPKTGIVACQLRDTHGSLDSTGDIYTTWGLPYPRGRKEAASDAYDTQTAIFGASGGASLYRIAMLQQIGLFDEDFFAYYEDVDISFRAQLAGWKVSYVPSAIAYHQIGATSSQIKGFTTYQTMKNLPWLLWKNVPLGLLPTILPRFAVAYSSFFVSAVRRGQGLSAIKGWGVMVWFFPKKLFERVRIQKNRRVSTNYIRSMLTHDLPPNATKLRNLRAKWRR